MSPRQHVLPGPLGHAVARRLVATPPPPPPAVHAGGWVSPTDSVDTPRSRSHSPPRVDWVSVSASVRARSRSRSRSPPAVGPYEYPMSLIPVRAGLSPSLVDALPWFGRPIRHTSCPLQVPSVRPQVRCGVCDVRPHLGWGSVPEHHPVGRVCQLLPRFVAGALGCGMPEDQCCVGFRERRVSKIGVRETVRARSCRNLPPDSTSCSAGSAR